jgi:hypothetical protein
VWGRREAVKKTAALRPWRLEAEDGGGEDCVASSELKTTATR